MTEPDAESGVDGREELDRTLGAHVSKGLRWSLLSTFAARLVTPLVGIVLARLLVPTQFGVYAAAIIAMSALLSLNDLGMSVAISRWPTDPTAAAATASTIALASSAVLFAAIFVTAPWFANALSAPEAAGVLRLLAVSVLLDGAAAVPAGFLTRSFRQDRRAIADWSGLLVSTSLTLGLAFEGYGAWSLAWGRLAGSAVTMVFVYVFAPCRPRPGWDQRYVRALLANGLPLAGASLLVFAMLNVDYIVVGHNLGPAALGIYVLAFNLSSWPWNILSVTTRRVSIPAFARFQHDHDALVAVFLRSLHALVLIAIPVCTLLSALAGPLVGLVYGQEWAAAAAVLRWLAVLAFFRIMLDLCYDLLAAIGRARPLMYLQGLWTAALIVVLPIAATNGGIDGVGEGHVLVAATLMFPVYLFAVSRAGVRPHQFARAIWRPVIAGIGCWLLAVLVSSVIHENFPSLLIASSLALCLYLLTAMPLTELWRLPATLRGLIGSPPPSTAEADA